MKLSSRARGFNVTSGRPGFTIIELLIAVIVVGILAAAGLAKYQNFAEQGRRKTCLFHIQTIEHALATWETANGAFSPRAFTAFSFSTRAGRLVSTDAAATAAFNFTGGGPVGPDGSGGPNVAPPVLPGAPGGSVGAPSQFANGPAGASGPLTSIIRDDKVWVCPSALSQFYGGEIQNVSDTNDVGLRPSLSASIGNANIIGLIGRYGFVVVGPGMGNANLPANWLTPTAAANAIPSPQPPISICMCGCYGSYGPSTTAQPGTQPIPTNGGGGGGPVGANGSTLTRHSARW